MKARYFETLGDKNVRCFLCPHSCLIPASGTGICGVRKNNEGILETAIYGAVSSIALDPIEKKPLYHFFPGSRILSIGTVGCNLKCPYCQNWRISQNPNARTEFYRAEDVIFAALENNSIGIAYTYSEPIIWAEYLFDAAEAARANGLKNVLVTNGFADKTFLDDILPQIDAMNIDLKSFNENTFKKTHKGKLQYVLDTIEKVFHSECHLELTTLIVSGINDSIDEMREMIAFIKSLDPSIPWHLSRYFPAWKYDSKPTEESFMIRVYEEASAQLDYVYCGNMPSLSRFNNTFCRACGDLLVNRNGAERHIVSVYKKDGAVFCKKCGYKINMRL